MRKIYHQYAEYYDLIFQGKNYEAEAAYIHNQFSRFTRNLPKRICDMGCGTGRHAEYLAKLGYQVLCVDISSEMTAVAKRRLVGLSSAKIICANDEDVRLSPKVSCIISMFSTFNLKLTDNQVTQALANYHKNLLPKGLLIIDMVDKGNESFIKSFTRWGNKKHSTHTSLPQIGGKNTHRTVVELSDKSVVWHGDIAHLTKKYTVSEIARGRQYEFIDNVYLRFYTVPAICSKVQSGGFSILSLGKGFQKDSDGRIILVGRLQ